MDRRRFFKYVGTGLVAAAAAGAGYLFYGKQRGAAPTGTLTTSLAHTTATTSAEVYEGLRVVFPEPKQYQHQYEYDADFESIEFLDENSNVIYSRGVWSSVDREYRVPSIPESARFTKLKASAHPSYSCWDDVSFNEIKKKAKRLDVYFAGRKVDSTQICARDETYYLRLKPEMDSDRDGILDGDDFNPRVPEPRRVKPRNDVTLIAVYLPSWGAKYPPWWRGATNPKSLTLTIGTELHPILGQRHPIDPAGTYDSRDPDIADWHIKWALEHGVTAFMIDWSPIEVDPSGAFHHTFEDGFLRANYRDMMKFGIMHITDQTWDYPEWFRGYEHVKLTARRGLDYVKENYFDYPSYLRLGKRYFYMLFRISEYAIEHGLDRLNDLVDSLHDQDVYLVGDVGPYGVYHDRPLNEKIVRVFDAISAYNWLEAGAQEHIRIVKRNGVDVWTLIAPYSQMASGYYREWRYWSELAKDCGVDFITPLCSGFSNKAAYESGAAYRENFHVERTGRTPELFRKMCLDSVGFIEKSRTNMCLIDGWNEIHESSTLEPMVEHAFDYLDVVRDVFCDEPGGGWPPNVVPTRDGVRQYLA